MQSLARYIHSLQLRLGIYTDVGARTCGGYVGSWRHECQDAATFSAWGIDYIKEDRAFHLFCAVGLGLSAF
jgi:alpha-galactosidase